MKKLLFIVMLAFAGCICSPPDHKAVVVLNHSKYPSDTVTINYYRSLRVERTSSGDNYLADANDNNFGECSSFSILQEWEIKPGEEPQAVEKTQETPAEEPAEEEQQ